MEILEHEDMENGSDRTTKEQVQIRNAGRAQAWSDNGFLPIVPL